MPVYEYLCRRCDRPFTETMHVDEHEKGVPPCPRCKKKDQVKRMLSTFTAVTSRKSAAY